MGASRDVHQATDADIASICQIGLVVVRAGEIANTWSTLVNPEDFFDDINVEIHGIDGDRVAHAPTFPDIFDEFSDRTTRAFAPRIERLGSGYCSSPPTTFILMADILMADEKTEGDSKTARTSR